MKPHYVPYASASPYIDHVSGVMGLMVWMSRWSALPNAIAWSADQVRLGPIVSSRIGLCLPRHPTARDAVCLAFQQDEKAWARRIQWIQAAWCRKEQCIALLAHCDQVPTGGLCVPPFLLLVAVDDPRKQAALAESPQLQSRALSWAGSAPRVGRGPPFWSVPMSRVNSVNLIELPTNAAGMSFSQWQSERRDGLLEGQLRQG